MTDVLGYKKKQDEQTMIKTDTGRRKKEQFIENLREGDVVNDFFAVKLKNPPRIYKRGTWFSIVATDKTGEIGVKFWGGDNKDRVKRLYDSFKVGDVVQIRLGSVEIYEETPQISINETTGGMRRCSPSEYDVSDFIPSLEEDRIANLFEMVKAEVASLKNQQLRSLLELFFADKDFVKDYTHAPSAITHHHNYVGGNLEHTVGVIRLCNNICEMYPGIDRDLVIAGAILHDIGKLKEYRTTAAIDKTDEGNFIGHIVIGEHWVREKSALLREKGKPFDEKLEQYLCHLILSHHGKYEFGSPRMPKIVEAVVLHAADMMDSQVKNYIQTIEEGKKASDEDWGFIWDSNLGRRRIMFLGEYETS
ncbi:MAG: HD domain-containing protein [Candidatus Thermoplasmatota archaeon]|nr:HD domain-containing protein [Candidatus Thermoplasmatota archaeon]